MIKKIAILRGFPKNKKNDLSKCLNSSQITAIFWDGSSEVIAELRNFIYNLIESEKSNKIHCKLFSLLSDSNNICLDRDLFFPFLRRVQIDEESYNGNNIVENISEIIISSLSSEEMHYFSKKISPEGATYLLLPLRNSKINNIVESFEEIFFSKSDDVKGNFFKRVRKIKKEKSYNIYGMKFSAITNGTKHPIRRITETARCDLSSILRFGVSLSKRFEFDVTTSGKFKDKLFYFCCGNSVKITTNPTHLNMRINDDFDYPK